MDSYYRLMATTTTPEKKKQTNKKNNYSEEGAQGAQMIFHSNLHSIIDVKGNIIDSMRYLCHYFWFSWCACHEVWRRVLVWISVIGSSRSQTWLARSCSWITGGTIDRAVHIGVRTRGTLQARALTGGCLVQSCHVYYWCSAGMNLKDTSSLSAPYPFIIVNHVRNDHAVSIGSSKRSPGMKSVQMCNQDSLTPGNDRTQSECTTTRRGRS